LPLAHQGLVAAVEGGLIGGHGHVLPDHLNLAAGLDLIAGSVMVHDIGADNHAGRGGLFGSLQQGRHQQE
jgi:hypothetical protein